MMKFSKMKTLRFQIFFISTIMTCVLIVLLGISIRRSFETGKNSEYYILKNEIINHLNAAAGWQAIERGYSATIIGSGKGDSSPLFSKFVEMGEKGDAEVLQVDKYMRKFLSINKDEALKDRLYTWTRGYREFQDARPRIAYKNISKHEWLEIATNNINNEFNLRNTTFIPQSFEENIFFLDNVLCPNVTRLCEYAGLERALVGNNIASGLPFSHETSTKIKNYRSIVEQSLDQILSLKESPSISSQIKQAIDIFDKEFLQKFQLLREGVFSASERQLEEVKNVESQIVERVTFFRNDLSGISNDLLNMSKHKKVIALAKALSAEEDIHLSERMVAVENLFSSFSQIKRVYAQIRFLDNSGYERVRVDFDGNATKIISGTQLQDKSDGYYFKETLNLPPGGIYTSPLDLNMEYGRIENPHKPIIRFVTPVITDGKRAGIVVFNVLADLLFLHKHTEKEERGDYILANQDGFYLHHPNQWKEWGMMELLNKSHHNIRQDYPDVAEQILSGKGGVVRLVSGRVIVYEPFFPNYESDTGKFWIIIKRVEGVEYPVSASAWFDAATNAINTGLAISNLAGVEAKTNTLKMKHAARRNMLISYSILGSSIIVLILFIRWSKYKILKPILNLAEVTRKITQGDFSQRVKIESRDEIGAMAISFNKMTDELTNEISNRKRVEGLLKQSEAKYREIIDTAQDAIISIDKDGIVIVWNKMAEKIFGYLKNEIIGQSITTIIPERYRKQHEDGMHRFLNTCETKIIGKTVEVSGITKKGIEVPIEMSLSFQKDIEDRYTFLAIIRDITEKQKREDEIRKLYSAIEQSPVSVVITDTKGDIEYVNKKFMKVTGYTYEEVIGKNPRVLKSGKTTPDVYKELWKTITSDKAWRGELCNKKKNGELYWEYVSISPVKNNEGIITHFIAVKEDITNQKQMDMFREQAHLRLEKINKLQQLLLGHGSLEKKLKKITDSVVELFDADFCRIWVIRPGDRCESGCIHAAVTEGHHVCRYRDRCLHLLSSSGRYTHIDGEVHSRVPFGCYKIGLVAEGKKQKFLTNDVTHDPLIHNNDWASELGLVSFAGYQLSPPHGETIGVMALFSKHIISPDDDRLMEMLSHSTVQVIQDTTMEDMLRSSNKKLELLFSSIPSILIELTNDYKIRRWNTSAENIFGIAASDVIGRLFRECSIQWDWDLVFEKISLCQKSNCAILIDDFKYKLHDGNYGFLGITINTIKNGVDEQTGLLLLMKDVTEHKNLEQQLVHAQKLEAIGELAAGIAHEINTPTQFITDNTFFLQDAFSKTTTLLKKYSHLLDMNKEGSVTPELINELDDMARDIKLGYLIEEIPVAIRETQNGLGHVTEIVKSMKTFSHPDGKEKVSVDINEMIKSTITVSKNEWKYVADIETDFDSNLPHVSCYPGALNQVTLNLLINATHAIEEVVNNGGGSKGIIRVSTHCKGDWAEIRISDTGAGIPEDIRSRIFEPFFTTKEVGKGTGQGLSIAHSVIVKKHNGKIDFVTEIGKGTTFKICLPVINSQGEVAKSRV
jgi:PAS domain S-box-containing protein